MNSIALKKCNKLFSHPLFDHIHTIEDCRVFMEHHIFAVWDFMSLAKKVQEIFAPITTPWQISINPKLCRFINEIILAEESDILEDGRIMSHCEMYLEAMQEVGASTYNFKRFLAAIQTYDLYSMEVSQFVPEPSYEFMKTTFSIVNSKQAHLIAGGFCYGREDIIPGMFISLLNNNGISESNTPVFREYLAKHIDLDGDIHGPMSVEMTQYLCRDDYQKKLEVESIRLQVMHARTKLWDGVHRALNHI